MIDLHSHLLPAVDDGARSVQQAVRALRYMAEQGVTDVCLTPHLLASETEAGVPHRHDAAFETLRKAAPETPRLHRAAEIMLDRPLPAAAAGDRRLRIAGSRYVLVEFPRLIAEHAVRLALTHVAELGLVPLLAHPERYSSCSPEAVARWRSIGARMQLDANTLLSPYPRGERARALLAAGLGDIVAADNHGDERTVAPVRAALIEQGAEDQAKLLADANPRAILDDAVTTLVEPAELKLPFMSRIRGFFGGGEE